MKNLSICVIVAAAIACQGGGGRSSGDLVVSVTTQALTVPGQLTRVSVTVTAVGGTTPVVSRDLAFNPTTGAFAGTLAVPVGTWTLTGTAYQGQAVVGSGSATITVARGAPTTALLRVIDATGAAPAPNGGGPFVASITASKVAPVIGEAISLTAAAIASNGQPITFAWTQSCASGTFSSAASATTTWSANAQGACTLTVTASQGQVTNSAAITITVTATAATGNVAVSGSFVPTPTIQTVAVVAANGARCDLTRAGTDGRCVVAAASGDVLRVTLDGGAAGAVYGLSDDCGGSAAAAGTGAFDWTAPSSGGLCALSATKNVGGAVDTFAFSLLVTPSGSATVAQEFDWTPGVIANPSRSFVERATTTAHIVWNGTSFVDAMGRITFVPQQVQPPDTLVNLFSPAQHAVGPWITGATRYVADAAHGANAIDTSGDFSVCVKFKPGVHPGYLNPNKVLLARGQAEGPTDVWAEGWALMQMHGAYCFHYRTAAGENMAPFVIDAAEPNPESYTYDYICGGRAGDVVHSSAHGYGASGDSAVVGRFATNGLPLVIGSYPSGDDAALDEQVYEIIFDSRPATAATFNDIVADAEGRRLANGAYTLPPFVAGTPVEMNGESFVLPAYANTGSWPFAIANNAAPGNAQIRYQNPLRESTTATGWCVGAEIVADDTWGAVQGEAVSYSSAARQEYAGIRIQPGSSACLTVQNATGGYQADCTSLANTGWVRGSRHKLTACVPAAEHTLQLFVDGNRTNRLTGNISVPVADLGAADGALVIGASMTGAHIARVFACASADPTTCQ